MYANVFLTITDENGIGTLPAILIQYGKLCGFFTVRIK
jgi:hypothetical protein